jgi:hypothetical protein
VPSGSSSVRFASIATALNATPPPGAACEVQHPILHRHRQHIPACTCRRTREIRLNRRVREARAHLGPRRATRRYAWDGRCSNCASLDVARWRCAAAKLVPATGGRRNRNWRRCRFRELSSLATMAAARTTTRKEHLLCHRRGAGRGWRSPINGEPDLRATKGRSDAVPRSATALDRTPSRASRAAPDRRG